MDWLNLHTSVLDDVTLATADDAQRGVWLHLMRYCIGQENSGRIAGAREWHDKKWLLLCRVSRETLQQPSELWTWRDDDLLVWGYPKEKQKEVQAKRKGGHIGGKRSAQARLNLSRSPASSSASTTLSSSASTEGERKDKSKENRKEKENGSFPEQVYLAYPKHVGKRDALKAIERILAEGNVTPEDLLARTTAYATAVAGWPAAERAYVPHPATWFNRGSFEDDPETWHRGKKFPSGSRTRVAADEPFDESKPFAHTGGIPPASQMERPAGAPAPNEITGGEGGAQ